MTIYAVKENDQLDKFIKLLGNQSFPGLANSIKISANMVQREWVKTIKNSKAKNGWKNEYIKSIHINFENEMSSEVYADENKYIDFIEDGVKRFDMKPGLINGPNSRQGKNGRYNIIFMRKGIPGTQHIQNMPVVTYQKIKKMSKEGLVKRYNTIGIGNVMQLKTKQVKKRTKNKSEKYEGLQKIGSKGHSQFGTFRVVSKKSEGWIYPGSSSIKIFSTVSRKVEPKVKKILQDGLKMDIEAGLKYLEG